MKTLRKIRKNAKALSPVVASIILIAVTVAVSIAVAAWMGALTVGFMGSSSVTITDVAFQGDTNNEIVLTVKNTGTKTVTLISAKVNGGTSISITDGTIAPDDDPITITLTSPWVNGSPYKIDLYDSSGQVIGAYQATAPGA
jgi:flagellin-like protein